MKCKKTKIDRFKIYEAASDPEVEKVIQMFKANPERYFFTQKTMEKMTEEDWKKVAENYLDFPFRLPKMP
jgi:hypothetical protein